MPLNFKSPLPLKSLLIALLLSVAVGANAQETSQLAIVKADSTWGKEIIKFPIDWAPEITFKGFEELRFAPQRTNMEHEEFWTLVLSWSVQTTKEISQKELEFNFYHYFDMLMKPNHFAQEFPEPELLFYDYDVNNTDTLFKGKMTFFDGLISGKMITVNILGSQTLCKTIGKAYVIFKISPQQFTHPIWEKLEKITLKDDNCIH